VQFGNRRPLVCVPLDEPIAMPDDLGLPDAGFDAIRWRNAV
jgi:hypothetical protein